MTQALVIAALCSPILFMALTWNAIQPGAYDPPEDEPGVISPTPQEERK